MVRENDEEQKQKVDKRHSSQFFNGCIGNMWENVPKRKTSEEYWKEEREKIKEEYLAVFDKTESKILKRLLVNFSLNVRGDFFMWLDDFDSLTENDFKDIKSLVSHINIIPCDPRRVIYSIYRKKEVEKYKMKFVPTKQTLEDLYNQENWKIDRYTFCLK